MTVIIFGENTRIYCPWDVLSYLEDHRTNPNLLPKEYWVNTGSPALINKFIADYYEELAPDLEALFKGESVLADYAEDLTYITLHTDCNNFWMLLYFTGYLTKLESFLDHNKIKVRLIFPNTEIKNIFVKMLDSVYQQRISKLGLSSLHQSFWDGNADKIAAVISDILAATISYFDYREDFYHALVLGMWAGDKRYLTYSNKESGLGRADIIIKQLQTNNVLVIECKWTKNPARLQSLAQTALQQIDEKGYAARYPALSSKNLEYFTAP